MEHSVSSTHLPLVGFDYQPRTRLIFGPNTIDQIGGIALSLGASRALLVTDPGIVKAGHAERVSRSLRDSGVAVTVFESVHENPTNRDVEECVGVAREAKIDFIIGLGGGSAMDTAKGCNFILTNGGRMHDYWGIGKAAKPMLPLIAAPTTAGTGSECQSFALIADENSHQKMACGDPKAAARVAILDPTLTLSQPPRVTACTGIDAIAHAVETAVTKKKSALSWLFAREAFQLCMNGFERVLEDPQDLDARGRMLLGAAYAGIAIENSMLGAAHSAANPLTAHFNVIHGQAVGLMLPHVVRFNASEPSAARSYAELALLVHLVDPATPGLKAADVLAARLIELLQIAKLPTRLRDCAVDQATIPVMAEEASKQWTATFNPRAITAPDFISLYKQAF